MCRSHTEGQHELQQGKGPTSILIGSTFPMAKIRRRVVVTPRTVNELCSILKTTPHESFWGHQNTLEAARRLLGVDLTPRTSRPTLKLDPQGYPMLEGISFKTCWILSPDYAAGFRPAIGEEVNLQQITGWQVLKMEWA